MRRYWALPALGLVLILSLAGFIVVSEIAHSPAGLNKSLSVLRDSSEQAWVRLSRDRATQADRQLNLTAHRVAQLAEAEGIEAEMLAAARADRALDRSLVAVAAAPPAQAQRLRYALAGIAAAHMAALDRSIVLAHDEPHRFRRLQAKLSTLQLLLTDEAIPNSWLARVAGIRVPFSDRVGALGLAIVTNGRDTPLLHDRFALIGAHASVDCASCHTDGGKPSGRAQVEGLPAAPPRCDSCHQSVRPGDHAPDACVKCHAPFAWRQATFDHLAGGPADCQVCHLGKKPASHTRDDCASCHSSRSWIWWGNAAVQRVAAQPEVARRSSDVHDIMRARPAPQNAPQSQAGVHPTGSDLDCRLCHAAAKPVGHYPLQCSTCHVAGTSWKRAAFTHGTSGATDCAGCHAAQKPDKHYTPQCSACHTAGTSWSQVTFSHSAAGATDCAGCHAARKPANHFPGQCSSCHVSTTSWQQVTFNHQVAGATDCAGCHAARKPANHFPGQCSSCHVSTTSWQQVTFNHQVAGATDCAGCHAARKPANHFPGQCSQCHTPAKPWSDAGYGHAGASLDCRGCHASRAPANHFTAQCSACHNANAWKPATFSHQAAGATDCAGCHEAQRPPSHFSGQCSQCHATGGSWTPAQFSHQGDNLDCRGCHASRAPANHFSGQCSACHVSSGWQPATFSHQAAGATDCVGCHGAQRPGNHLQGQCSECHNAGTSWMPPAVGHAFPMDHKGADRNCSTCHPSLTRDWTCYGCHNQSELEKHHREKEIPEITGLCMQCHPDGRKHDD